MRLAMINTRMPGVNTFLVRDLRGLIRDGIRLDIYLFETRSLDRSFRAEAEAAGSSVFHVPFPGGFSAFGALLREALRHPVRLGASLGLGLRTLLVSPREGIRALAVLPTSLLLGRKMRQDGVEQVHGMWAGVPASVAFWIHRHAGLPMSLSGHAWDVTGRTRLLPEKVRASAGMVVCSRFAHRVVAEVVGPSLARQVRVVHHGLTLSQWPFQPERSPADRPPLILAVGRLTAKKGFRYLVEACAFLRDRSRAFTCEIIGPDGGSGAELTRLIGQHRLETLVRLTGELPPDQVKARMAEADLLAMPSIRLDGGGSDGIPNVVLESMALGTPVVATDAGGIAEVVHPGETGWIVEQKNAAELADAMEEVLRDPELGRCRARAARAVVEAEFNGDALGRVFLEAIGAANGPPKPGNRN